MSSNVTLYKVGRRADGELEMFSVEAEDKGGHYHVKQWGDELTMQAFNSVGYRSKDRINCLSPMEAIRDHYEMLKLAKARFEGELNLNRYDWSSLADLEERVKNRKPVMSSMMAEDDDE